MKPQGGLTTTPGQKKSGTTGSCSCKHDCNAEPWLQEADPKSYSKSKYAAREKSRGIESAISATQQAHAKHRKAHKRSFAGMFQSHAGTADPDVSMEKKLRAFFTPTDPTMSQKILDVAIIQSAFVANICVADTPVQFSAATVQMVTSMVCSSNIGLGDMIMKFIGDWYADPFDTAATRMAMKETTQQIKSATADNQKRIADLKARRARMAEDAVSHGFVEWTQTLRDKLEAVKTSAASFTSIPVYKQLSRCFVICSFFGLMPAGDANGDTMAKCLHHWNKRMTAQTENLTFYDVALDSAIFVCDFILYADRGELGRFITPDDLQVRCCELLALQKEFKNGMLEDAGTSLGEYQENVRRACKDLKQMIAVTQRGAPLMMLQRLLVDIQALSTAVSLAQRNAAPRVAAPIICFYGGSHVGKSGVMQATATTIGQAAGFPTEDKNFFYVVPGDDYDSNFKGDKTVIFEDDKDCLANDKGSGRNATSDIRHCNTTPYFSIQADIDGKGAIPFQHKIKIVSTNSEDVGVPTNFKHPEAAHNRMWQYHVYNPEYARKNGKLDPSRIDTKRKGLDPSVYLFQKMTWIYGPLPEKESTGAAHKKKKAASDRAPKLGWQVDYDEHVMDLPEFMTHIVERYKAHHDGGSSYLEKIKDMRTATYCTTCYRPKLPGYCVCPPPAEATDEGDGSIEEAVSHALETITAGPAAFIQEQTLAYMLTFIPLFENMNAVFERHVMSLMLGKLGRAVIGIALSLLSVFRVNLLLGLWFAIPAFIVTKIVLLPVDIIYVPGDTMLRWILLVWWVLSYCGAAYLKRVYVKACLKHLSSTDINNPARVAFRFATLSSVLAASILFAFRAMRLFGTSQGNLAPTSMEEVEDRNSEKNNWLTPNVEPVSVLNRVRTSTFDQSKAMISKNVCHCTVSTVNGTYMTIGILFIKSNTAVISDHLLEKVDRDKPIKIVRGFKSGQVTPSAMISMSHSMGNDYSVITVTQTPSFSNIVDCFAENYVQGQHVCTMVSRTAEGNLEERTLMHDHQDAVYNADATAPGSMHQCSLPTRPGLCGSPLIMHSPPAIVGLHCGGLTTDRNTGVSFSVTRTMLIDAMDAMTTLERESHSFVGEPPLDYADVNLSPFGKEVLNLSSNIHPRDNVNWMNPASEDHPHSIEVFGSDPSQKFKRFSEVRETFLSPHLAEQGRPQKWGRPKFNVNRNMAETFAKLQKPMRGVAHWLCELAAVDYLKSIVVKIKELGMTAKPLTKAEAVNGIPHSRFVKRLNMKTSAGIGLNGPKEKYFEESEDEDGRKVYSMSPELEEAFDAAHEELRSGKIPHLILTTALKDEPTKLEKKKVRVFTIAPTVFNLLLRMYVLPIMNCLYFIPLVAEMAQGINCTNDEWDQLGTWIESLDPTQCLAGDHSSFDLGASGQMMRISAWITRQIALALGYSIEQALCVQLLLIAISHKLIVWNGTLIRVDSLMPSGVSVTIFINGINNALYHRIVFFSMLRRRGENVMVAFRDFVRLMYVGDDVIGSTTLKWFTMACVQTVLATYGLVYTDADKNEVTTEFYHFDEIQFCKRTFARHEMIDKLVAPIALDSIYKSLHCHMMSTTPVEEIVCGNVDGALRELARHPRSVFETEAAVIRKACESAGIRHLIKRIDYDYIMWWEILKDDFTPEKEEEDSSGSECLSESLD